MPNQEVFTCDLCHEEHPVSERRVYGSLALCSSCYESETVLCDHCGERIWVEDAESDGRTSLCQSCYDRYYTCCYGCERIIHYDNAYYPDDGDDPYCGSCSDSVRSSHKIIKSYCYKPLPIFYGDDSCRFFGLELEIDDGGESSANAAKLLAIMNRKAEYAYCKHDGSLEDGFEIVTHSMTLDYHIKSVPWREMVEAAVEMGYRSHQAGTCGLHVHVNRSAFGDTEAMQEAAIARILFFVENHWHELLRFSRRTRSQMEQWAARYGRKDNPKEQIEHVKNNFADRYRAVNLTNASTIEFRMFRGTLRYNTIIATLQLINEICELASFLSDDEMASLTWTDFCAMVGNLNYPELVQYLKERRLYVCEPVPAEAEI